MAQSFVTAQSTISKFIAVNPSDLLTTHDEKWAKIYKKRVVKPCGVRVEDNVALKLVSLPEMPGAGRMATVADVVPTVKISAMHPSQYLAFASAIMMYSSAEWCVQAPRIASLRGSVEYRNTLMLVTSARAATWGALGVTPSSDMIREHTALRWSNKVGTVVVRGATETPEADLWRHFLATSPGCPDSMVELCQALIGLAPMLFLYGASLNLANGDLLSSHFVEREMAAYAKAQLSARTYAEFGLQQSNTWEIMGAAAVSGFSASFTRHVSSDPAFITMAQAKIASVNRNALLARLQNCLAKAPNAGLVMSDTMPSAPRRYKVTAADEADELESVADTEADFELPGITTRSNIHDFLATVQDAADDNSVTPRPSTPVPVLTTAEVGQIRDAAKKAMEMPNAAVSLIRDADPDESANW
jgi:hypothetical protein